MVEQAKMLYSTALEAIADLERRVVAADGGRLKLEWGDLRHRSGTEARDLFWWENGRLVGFLGIYGNGKRPLEITGMVDFTARRRGIGSALLEASLPLCGALGADKLLMVVPRNSAGGSEFARSFGMTYEHSEHALTLAARPNGGPADTALAMRQATTDDLPALSRLYLDGFGDGQVDDRRLETERSRTMMITYGGETVGTIALGRDGARGGIYGFVVDSSRRRHGIGRQALRSACKDLFDQGADHVDLEVLVENESALGLYTSLGFTPLATDDYFELIFGGPASQAA